MTPKWTPKGAPKGPQKGVPKWSQSGGQKRWFSIGFKRKSKKSGAKGRKARFIHVVLGLFGCLMISLCVLSCFSVCCFFFRFVCCNLFILVVLFCLRRPFISYLFNCVYCCICFILYVSVSLFVFFMCVCVVFFCYLF